MITHLVYLAAGFLFVIKGGELFVDSSVNISGVLGIPRLVIGATIVSIATTVPELTVSAMASAMGDSGIALGNAVGSAIANIGLIIGVVAMITVVQIDLQEFRRRVVWMIASAFLVILFSWNLRLPRPYAALLLGVSMAYLFFDYWKVSRRTKSAVVKEEENPQAGADVPVPLRKSLIQFLIGIAGVIIGSRFLVSAGVGIAQGLGIPSVVIGLSIIAVGTSLPELVTGITAARKGVADLSIGNIVGANVLNLAMICGVSGTIHPLTLNRFTQVYSYPWLLVFIFLLIYMFKKKGIIAKKDGCILLILYGLYLCGLFFMPQFFSA